MECHRERTKLYVESDSRSALPLRSLTAAVLGDPLQLLTLVPCLAYRQQCLNFILLLPTGAGETAQIIGQQLRNIMQAAAPQRQQGQQRPPPTAQQGQPSQSQRGVQPGGQGGQQGYLQAVPTQGK